MAISLLQARTATWVLSAPIDSSNPVLQELTVLLDPIHHLLELWPVYTQAILPLLQMAATAAAVEPSLPSSVPQAVDRIQ